MCRRRVVLALVASLACSVPAAPAPGGPGQDVDALLTRVAGRVADYYRRAQSLICVERSTVQPIDRNWSPDGMPRTVESDLHVEFDAAARDALPEARLIRDIRRINGRAPRDRDAKSRAGCTDPNPLSPEPLAFLLPAARDQYRFTSVRNGKEQDRDALVIAFQSTTRRSRLELVEDERGHDDCFDWRGPLATSGRVWVDARTHDVLRVERHIDGPVDIRVPWTLQRKRGFDQYVILDRDDLTLRYRAVPFTEPAETILLPQSIDSITVVRHGLQSTRRTETFSDYRRFLTGSRIIKSR